MAEEGSNELLQVAGREVYWGNGGRARWDGQKVPHVRDLRRRKRHGSYCVLVQRDQGGEGRKGKEGVGEGE